MTLSHRPCLAHCSMSLTLWLLRPLTLSFTGSWGVTLYWVPWPTLIFPSWFYIDIYKHICVYIHTHTYFLLRDIYMKNIWRYEEACGVCVCIHVWSFISSSPKMLGFPRLIRLFLAINITLVIALLRGFMLMIVSLTMTSNYETPTWSVQSTDYWTFLLNQCVQKGILIPSPQTWLSSCAP